MQLRKTWYIVSPHQPKTAHRAMQNNRLTDKT
jgi:hypothetical protein